MCKLAAGEMAWVTGLGALPIPSQHPLAAHNQTPVSGTTDPKYATIALSVTSPVSCFDSPGHTFNSHTPVYKTDTITFPFKVGHWQNGQKLNITTKNTLHLPILLILLPTSCFLGVEGCLMFLRLASNSRCSMLLRMTLISDSSTAVLVYEVLGQNQGFVHAR